MIRANRFTRITLRIARATKFKINPAVRAIARQVRDKNCLAAIFAPATSICLFWPTGKGLNLWIY